ncbi:MAG: protoporphyrinogen oxidase [Betaproteobacteria bacterium]
MIPVVIVGGGIAGLSAAYELHARGVPFMLVERGPRAGGVILSEQIDGFTLDGGPDALLIQKPEGVALCRELGLGDRLVPTRPPRVAYILRRGVLHPLPDASVLGIPTRVGPFVRTRLFSWPGKLRMGMELFVPARRDESDESIGHFIERRFGHEAKAYLAEPLLAGIHAGDVDRLSVKALFPRFAAAERKYGSLLKAFRAQAAAARAAGRSPSVDGAFLSLPDGLSEMVRALVQALPPESIRLNTAATRVVPDPREDRGANGGGRDGEGTFRVELAAGETLEAQAVVLAAPAYVAGTLVREADADLARLCEEVPYASSATVALGFRRDAVGHPLHGSGFLVPRVEELGILAASWLSSKWPGRAPGDRVLVRTFVGGARDPGALARTDAQLVSLSLDAIRPLLRIDGAPILTHVYRWSRANAQHDVGHVERMEAIERRLTAHPGLFVTGSGFRGVGIPDCVADARATAAKVTEWLRPTSVRP